MRNIRNIFQVVLIAVILGVTSHLLICNIEHMIYLNTKRYTIDFENGSEISNIKEKINNIKENIEKINKLENSYLSDEELQKIKSNLNEINSSISNSKIWNYTKKDNIMNEKEFYLFIRDMDNLPILSNIEIYRILAKYDEKLDVSKFVEYSLLLLISESDATKLITNNYQYLIKNVPSDVPNLDALGITNIFSNKLNTILYITDVVLESGDINE